MLLTDDKRSDDELDEAHLHVAETDGVAVAHGRHLQAERLLLVALQAELLRNMRQLVDTHIYSIYLDIHTYILLYRI